MERFPSLHDKLDAGVMRKAAFGPISLDLDSKTLRIEGTEIREKLEAQEYQILWLLVRAHGNIISETDIITFLYGDMPDEKDIPLGNTIQVRISDLRGMLEKLTGGTVRIVTHIRTGYSLEVHAGAE